MTKWNYKVKRVSLQELESELDRLGKKEWELVQIFQTSRELFDAEHRTIILILRRPRQGD